MIIDYSHAWRSEFGVKIGKISADFRPNTQGGKSKNQNFQNFSTYFPTSSYERRVTRDGYIFVSNTQVALIIGGGIEQFTIDYLSGMTSAKCAVLVRLTRNEWGRLLAYGVERIADRKFKLMAGKLLVGWFMECLACKATFIRTTPENWMVGQGGRIFRKDTGQQASGHDTGVVVNDTRQRTTGQDTGVVRRNLITSKRKFVGYVRCPDCLSAHVRLMEIGDGK